MTVIAPKHGVDDEELFKKAPSFPVNAAAPGQLQAFFADMQVRAEDMSEAELTVCMLASQTVVEALWQSIKSKYPDLPEFR